MDFNAIKEFITGIGFPIFACCVMFKQNGKMQETLASIETAMTSMTERLKDIEVKINKEE